MSILLSLCWSTETPASAEQVLSDQSAPKKEDSAPALENTHPAESHMPELPEGIVGMKIKTSEETRLGTSVQKHVIIEVMANCPAEKAGLKVGDLITAVDSLPTEHWTAKEILAHLRGQPGTAATISFDRNGSSDVCICMRMNLNSLPAEQRAPFSAFSPEIRSQLEEFAKNGFGIKLLYKGQVDMPGKDNYFFCLSSPTRKSALAYLKLPARGEWTSPAATARYQEFLNSAVLEDRRCPCYHFIKGVHSFGMADYAHAKSELSEAIAKDSAFVAAIQVRSLSLFKNGELQNSAKDWNDANALLRPNNTNVEKWVKQVERRVKRHWKPSVKPPQSDEVSVILKIDKDGKILSAEVPQSSGKKALDQSVIDACLKGSPVEPPPSNLEAPVHVQLKFDLMTHGFRSW